MYLSDRDMAKAIGEGSLIVRPTPTIIGPSSIDLHLDSIDQAKVWNIAALEMHNRTHGLQPRHLRISQINYGEISKQYLMAPPTEASAPVQRKGDQIIVKPNGFLLWQTKEVVGTPEENPQFILFIDGKSTRARTGLVVHLTAPTIHAGWAGQVTLEITNLGPLDIVLEADDVIAQIVVARLTSPPEKSMRSAGSVTAGQRNVSGLAS